MSKKIGLNNELIQRIADAIMQGEELYEEYRVENNFPTNNGMAGARWNYINKAIERSLEITPLKSSVLKKSLWGFMGIYDEDTKTLYTLMREKNYQGLLNDNNKLHYVSALSTCNDSLTGNWGNCVQQISMFENFGYSREEDEYLEKSFEKFEGQLGCHVSRYVLITFEESRGEVSVLKAHILNKGFNLIYEENWSELIHPSYGTNLSASNAITSVDISSIQTVPLLEMIEDEDYKMNSK